MFPSMEVFLLGICVFDLTLTGIYVAIIELKNVHKSQYSNNNGSIYMNVYTCACVNIPCCV